MRRRTLLVVLGVLVLAGLVSGGAAGYQALVRVPRPDLPYPPGHLLVEVVGNCARGSELMGCEVDGGPRSLLTVRAPGDRRTAAAAMSAALKSAGWREDVAGLTARLYSDGGAPEDIQPLYCKDGCVGVVRLALDGYVLAWFES